MLAVTIVLDWFVVSLASVENSCAVDVGGCLTSHATAEASPSRAAADATRSPHGVSLLQAGSISHKIEHVQPPKEEAMRGASSVAVSPKHTDSAVIARKLSSEVSVNGGNRAHQVLSLAEGVASPSQDIGHMLGNVLPAVPLKKVPLAVFVVLLLFVVGIIIAAAYPFFSGSSEFRVEAITALTDLPEEEMHLARTSSPYHCQARMFCPDLVVPEGNLCTLFLPIEQDTPTWVIRDPDGTQILRATIKKENPWTLVLTNKGDKVIAQCSDASRRSKSEYHFHKASNEYYAKLVQDKTQGYYTVKLKDDARLQLMCADNCFRLSNEHGRELWSAEPSRELGSASLRLKTSPQADAGLAVCVVLCVAHLEKNLDPLGMRMGSKEALMRLGSEQSLQ